MKSPFDRLCAVLSVLSSCYDDQKNAFPHFVNVSDELALAFDEVWQSCQFLLGRGEVSQEVYDCMALINQKLDDMSENKSMWNDNALANSDEWGNIRSLSSCVCARLGAVLRHVELDWIRYEE